MGLQKHWNWTKIVGFSCKISFHMCAFFYPGFQQALKRDLFAGTPTGTAFVDLMSFFPQRKKTDFIAWTTTNTSCVKGNNINPLSIPNTLA